MFGLSGVHIFMRVFWEKLEGMFMIRILGKVALVVHMFTLRDLPISMITSRIYIRIREYTWS